MGAPAGAVLAVGSRGKEAARVWRSRERGPSGSAATAVYGADPGAVRYAAGLGDGNFVGVPSVRARHVQLAAPWRLHAQGTGSRVRDSVLVPRATRQLRPFARLLREPIAWHARHARGGCREGGVGAEPGEGRRRAASARRAGPRASLPAPAVAPAPPALRPRDAPPR